MSSKTSDLVRFKGFIKITSVENGEETVVIEDRNMTVNGAGALLAGMVKMASMGTADGCGISTMVFSDLGNDDLTNEFDAVVVTDTAMVGTTLTSIDIASCTVEVIMDDDSATFSATMPTEVAEGLVFREVGLFTEGGDLFAKKHFPSYQKNTSRELVVVWGIRFQKADTS